MSDDSKTSLNITTPYRHKFPYEIKAVDADINDELLQYFHGERTGFVQVGPERYFFPHKYQQEAEGYYNFEARTDDVWVVSFPRSGTTWTQELVWLVANNLDFETARNKQLTERFPFFEFPVFVHPEINRELIAENQHNKKNIEFIENMAQPGYEALSKISTSSRRFIKTHFPFSLLPPSIMEKQCKVIYVARNPKDVAISFYYLNRLYRTQGYVGDFSRYWNYFQKGLNPWLPYHSHLKEAQAMRDCPNVLLLNYEDMLNNLSQTVHQVASFLGKELSVAGEQNLLNHLNISNFRLNSSVNGNEMQELGILNKGEAGFIRKGSKDSNEEFSKFPGLMERADKWVQENSFNSNH